MKPTADQTNASRPMSFDQEPADLEDSGPRRRNRWYTTGEMARLSDNTLRTVRFYEEAGILKPIGRTEGGHRLFERTELDRLRLVTDMREAGLSLEEIRTLLDMRQQSTSGTDAAHQIVSALRKHMANLDHKVQVLVRLQDEFAKTVDIATKSTDVSTESTAGAPRALTVLFGLGQGASREASGAPPVAMAAGDKRRL